ncbi:retrovirus-related pol polyprotein from transposon TNT 1-94 [Tanacetum coccineum]
MGGNGGETGSNVGMRQYPSLLDVYGFLNLSFLAKKLCDIEKHMFEGKLVLLVDDGKPMKLTREDPTSQEEVVGHFEVSTRGAEVVVGSSVRGDKFVVRTVLEKEASHISFARLVTLESSKRVANFCILDTSTKTRAEVLIPLTSVLKTNASYVPWSSRFMRYFDGKNNYGKMTKDSIDKGQYVMKPMMDQGNLDGDPLVPLFEREREQKEADLTVDDKKQFKADIDVMNAILLGITNDIYNSVDACKTTQAIWQRVKRLMQDENNVNASRAKRAARTHDPLDLVTNHYAAPSCSPTSPAYYITHPPSVNDFDGESQLYEFQGDASNDDQMDNFTTTMMLLAKVSTQHYTTLTNKGLRASSNTRNQVYVQDGHVNVQKASRYTGRFDWNSGNATYDQQANGNNAIVQRVPRTSANSGNTSIVKCYNCNDKGHLARVCPKPRVRDSNYFKEQMLLAKKGKAGIDLKDEENDFLLADIPDEETLQTREKDLMIPEKEALVFYGPQRDPNKPLRIRNEKECGEDFMEEIIVKMADNKAHIFSKADYKYLYKDDIEDMY